MCSNCTCKDVYTAISNHFAITPPDIKHHIGDYPDEFEIFDRRIEVVKRETAIQNELDNLNGDGSQLYKYMHDDCIGIYTRMVGGKYYFRWM